MENLVTAEQMALCNGNIVEIEDAMLCTKEKCIHVEEASGMLKEIFMMTL